MEVDQNTYADAYIYVCYSEHGHGTGVMLSTSMMMPGSGVLPSPAPLTSSAPQDLGAPALVVEEVER